MHQSSPTPSHFYRRQFLFHIIPILATACLIYWLAGGIPPIAWAQLFQACTHFSALWASNALQSIFVLILLLIQSLLIALAWGFLIWLLVRELQALRSGTIATIPQLHPRSRQSTPPALPPHEIAPSISPDTYSQPVATYVQPNETAISLVHLLEPSEESDLFAQTYQQPFPHEQLLSSVPTWQLPSLPGQQPFPIDTETIPTSPLPTLPTTDDFASQPDIAPIPSASQQQITPLPAIMPNISYVPNAQPFASPSLESTYTPYTPASIDPTSQPDGSQFPFIEDDEDDDENPFAFDNPFGGSLPDVFQQNNNPPATPIPQTDSNKKRPKKRSP